MVRLVEGRFDPQYTSTLSVDYQEKTLVDKENREGKLRIWDTVGQERFRTITNSFYRGAYGVATRLSSLLTITR